MRSNWICAGLLFAGLAGSPAVSGGKTAGETVGAVAVPPANGPRPVVSSDLRHDLSLPLRLLPVVPLRLETEEVDRRRSLPNRRLGPEPGPGTFDAGRPIAPRISAGSMPSPLVSFEGVNNRNNGVPPDTSGDVGPSHVVQWVNGSFAVWDKSGALLYGPVNGNTLWAGFGGLCETTNRGDPIVQYDQLADRWLMSQLAFAWPSNFHQCVAVSQTGDPTGAWYRYDFPFSSTILNDYPKFGVWPDAYYLAVNQYQEPGDIWRGQGAIAFERNQLLVGGPARMVYFDLYGVNSNFGGALPSDLDGPIPPPAGSPNYFVEMDDDAWGWPGDRLDIWRFHVDWTNTALSTFGVGGNPDSVIDLTAAGYPFDSDLCGYAGNCLAQPGGGPVDALSDRLMYRVAYRNFGDHEALVLNHTVDVNGLNHAGIRWYEIRDPGAGTPVLHQAGTYSPDENHRWMGSIAQDGAGDVALGFSVSSTLIFPSIRYAGRLAADPPGSLPLAEATLIAGSGFQVDASRWGDYSTMSVDPTDDCTFWYTQEYYETSGHYPWQTRIGSFKIDGCGSCPLVGSPSLTVFPESPGIRLAWTAATDAAGYDTVEGSLSMLRSTGGDFAASTTSCLADNLAATFIHVDETPPTAGDGYWYLTRGERNGCRGTFDEPVPSQIGLRDGEISASPNTCP